MSQIFIRNVSMDAIRQAAVTLGLIDNVNFQPTGPGVCWYEIGIKYKPTGATDADGNPVMALSVDANGTPYQHVNLLLDTDLLSYAEALIATNPPNLAEIQALLAIQDQFFVLDQNGQPTPPANPVVVWWQ